SRDWSSDVCSSDLKQYVSLAACRLAKPQACGPPDKYRSQGTRDRADGEPVPPKQSLRPWSQSTDSPVSPVRHSAQPARCGLPTKPHQIQCGPFCSCVFSYELVLNVCAVFTQYLITYTA